MKQQIYEPVRKFERQTSYCPLYLAWRIVDEARDYFRTELIPSPVPPARDILSHPTGEGLAHKLARRAEAVFAHQPFWQRKYQSARGREYILMSMRHWLAGVLARERPAPVPRPGGKLQNRPSVAAKTHQHRGSAAPA